ncbi:MAG: hypothetical protein J6V72_21845 [Kiritimatiellae bacterium]|nr:hypothetical protein [Kiritimatiellia bacterium]
MATYYTYDQQTRRLTAAPRAIKTASGITFNASAVEYAKLGAYPRDDAYAPDGEPPDGKMWSRTGGYTLRAGAWCADYDAVVIPPPAPRRWSRLSIKTALAQAGMLAAARQFLSATEIATGYSAWEALTDRDHIEEGFGGAEAWDALLNGAAQALGKTREEIDAFLAQIPQEA